MTQLQNIELDIFRQFIEVCDKLQLPYYMVCGSALGAVKYGGFIPWDDDIDVGMPREAYEVFIEKAPALLPEPYFLQNYKTEPKVPMIYSKLRNSNTTYIEKSCAHLPINQGAYIDIFPLDGYPRSAPERWMLEIGKRVLNSQMCCVFNIPRRPRSQVLAVVWKLLGCHHRTAKIAAQYTRVISRYRISESDFVCNHGNWQMTLEYAPKGQYGEGMYTVFEGIKVRIPENYDAYLTQKYGEWRAELPKEQQTGHHYYEVCDMEKPYTNYISK